MSLLVGIIGLPNVGKSTLFNALIKREIAKVGPHPFTTITPNKGMVEVPDKNLDKLLKMLTKNPLAAGNSNKAADIKVKPCSIEFVDIAGLVKGAAEGAGLGNQFLSHIREVDLILHVLREFKNEKAPHVSSSIDPVRDAATVDLELILADFEVVNRAIQERIKKSVSDKQAKKELDILYLVEKVLKDGKPAIAAGLDKEEIKLITSFNLLTLKPVIFILNIAEKHLEESDYPRDKMPKGIVLPVCIKLAADLYDLDKNDRLEFLKQYKIKTTGLEQIIKLAFKTLGLITFYTIKGGKIISAWPIEDGANALDGADNIHTDFGKRFVKAEVINIKRLLKIQDWRKAKEKGLLQLQGKQYKILNGDVIEFILN